MLKTELSAKEYDEIINHRSGSSGGRSPAVAAAKPTMETFLATLGQVQQTYSQSRHHDKARRWLNTFADRVVYYGNIIDVLVQHHPEYASLAWGLFKLIFVVRLLFFFLAVLARHPPF